MSVSGVTLGTMTDERDESYLRVTIDHMSQELCLELDNLLADDIDREHAAEIAKCCVGPGKSIRCLEEDHGRWNVIRVKIDADSELAAGLTVSALDTLPASVATAILEM